MNKKVLIFVLFVCTVLQMYAVNPPNTQSVTVTLNNDIHRHIFEAAPGVISCRMNNRLDIDIPFQTVDFALFHSPILSIHGTLYNNLVWFQSYPVAEEIGVSVKQPFSTALAEGFSTSWNGGCSLVINNLTESCGIALDGGAAIGYRAAEWLEVFLPVQCSFYLDGFRTVFALNLRPFMPRAGVAFNLGIKYSLMVPYDFSAVTDDVLFILGVGYGY